MHFCPGRTQLRREVSSCNLVQVGNDGLVVVLRSAAPDPAQAF
jgi:hypothetical protein